MPGILAASVDRASYALAGGSSSAFEDSWASAIWLYPDAGAAWNQTHPVSAPRAALPGFGPQVDSGDAIVASTAYALGEYVLEGDPDRPLIQVVTLDGALRAGTSKREFGPVS